MKSRITAQFRQSFGDLPEQIQQQTREAYRSNKIPTIQACVSKKYIQNYQFIQHGLA